MNRRHLLKTAAAVLATITAGRAFADGTHGTWRYSKEPSAADRAAFESLFGKTVGPLALASEVDFHEPAPAPGRAWLVASGGRRVVLTHTDVDGRVIERIEFERG